MQQTSLYWKKKRKEHNRKEREGNGKGKDKRQDRTGKEKERKRKGRLIQRLDQKEEVASNSEVRVEMVQTEKQTTQLKERCLRA